MVHPEMENKRYAPKGQLADAEMYLLFLCPSICHKYPPKSTKSSEKWGIVMNQTNNQSLVKQAVKSKFKGKSERVSRTHTRYPDSAEREFQRIGRSYMRLLNKELKARLPEMMEIYKQDRYDSVNEDGFKDIEAKIREILREIAVNLENSLASFDLDAKVRKIANLTNNCTLSEWKRAIKTTLGIDITQDYYKGEMYTELLERWIAENVKAIKSMPTNTLGNLQEIILKGYKSGSSITQIRQAIQEEYNMEKRRAELLARDQVATLNAQVTKMQQNDAGVKKYKWSSSKDSRVRDCHNAFDGKIFSWDNPPEAWYETKKGRVYTGRKCHPGEDYCCRCVAIPVFDYNTIDVPMKGDN